MRDIPITPEGYKKLEEELDHLKGKDGRSAVIRDIAEAREHGDLSENAEYHAARERQGFIEGRITELESLIARAKIVSPESVKCDTVKFSATVSLLDEDSDEKVAYKIVGQTEADIEKGLLNFNAPLARALISKKVGDTVEVNTPRGDRTYEILKIDYI